MRAGVLGVALCALMCGFGAAQGVGRPVTISNNQRSVAITATDRVVSQADIATVHIGYVLYGADREAAYAAGSTVSQAIMKALRGAGVPDDAIESQQQSLAATDSDELKAMPAAVRAGRAFTVRQSWTVRVAAKDGKNVLDLAVHAGANESGDIDWSLRDANAAQAAAAEKAVQRARTQAEAIAHGLGVRLGTLLYASNEVDAAPTPTVVPHALSMSARMKEEREPAPPMAVNPQQIETSATVYAVFAMD